MARPEPSSVLAALGLAVESDRLYQRLRSQSGRSLERVAGSLLLTPQELREQLEPLLAIQIIRLDGERLVVEAPAEALRLMVAAQAAGAERARRQLDGISHAIGLLAADARRQPPTDREDSRPIEGEVVLGGDLHAMVRDLVLRSRGDLLWLRPEQWRGPSESRMAALVAEALKGTGRRSRAIYPLRALDDAPAALEARAAAGEEIRVLPELPTRLLVIGDSHAVLPEPIGYADLPLSVVRQRGVVEALRCWFERLWEQAAVPALTAGEPRPDLRRFLLHQLAAGAHDEQIARQLGLSLRTVRRRVADLMNDLGADSRFQAGAEAVRRGWL